MRDYIGAKRGHESRNLQPFSGFSCDQHQLAANISADRDDYFLDNFWSLPVDGDRHFGQRHEYHYSVRRGDVVHRQLHRKQRQQQRRILRAEPGEPTGRCIHHRLGYAGGGKWEPVYAFRAPHSIAIAPGGNFLYVGTATGIFLYSIGSGGALTLANNNNVISQDIATTMQVDSTGSWLVEAGPNLAELLAIRINSSNGIPTTGVEQNTLLPAATVQQLAISRDNAHVFVALGSSGTEDVTFAAGNGTPFGAVANLHVLSSGGNAVSVAVDPKSRLLYIGETAAISGSNAGGLRVFDYNTLVEVTGSPFATGGLAPYAIAPTYSGANSGNYVYVANRTVSGSSTGNIVGFAVNSSGTGLTALSSSVSAGITPLGLTQDSSGNYMIVVNQGGSPDLQAFTFDATTAGKLDSALTSATGNDPVQASSIAAAP